MQNEREEGNKSIQKMEDRDRKYGRMKKERRVYKMLKEKKKKKIKIKEREEIAEIRQSKKSGST